MSLRVLALKNSVRGPIRQSIPRSSLCLGLRYLSHTSTLLQQQPEPKAKAQSIINALPGNSILSKTGILGTSAAAAIYAISNELYVVNEESILLVTFLATIALLAKYVAPAYNDFADSRMKKVSDVLNASRMRHVDAVKERIGSVSELQNVSETTKILFDVSKETVELEAKSFELQQKVDLAAQAKSVLDSWVRYEASLRQLEQQQIAKSIISKVEAEISNPKFQDRVLQQSIGEVEKLFAGLK